MKHTPIVIIALLVGFGIGLAVGHTYLVKPNETTMLVVRDDKVIPHVSAGETLKWVGPGPNNPVTGIGIKLGGGLCNEEDKTTHKLGGNTCTVAKGVDSNGLSYARYVCDQCGDPDVAAGSDVSQGQQGQGAKATSAAASTPILVWCDPATIPGTAAADPVEVKVVVGQTISWGKAASVGNATWSVDGLLAACGSGNDSYTTGALCTVQSAPSPYTYNVHEIGRAHV